LKLQCDDESLADSASNFNLRRYKEDEKAEAFEPFNLKSEREEGQGLTLVHFSVQIEPFLIHKNTLHTLNTPRHPPTPPPLNTGCTTPKYTPYPIRSAQVELRSERV